MAQLDSSYQMDFTGLEFKMKNIELDGVSVTATAAEINAAADVSSKLVKIADADTYTFLAANSGKTHVVEAVTGDIAFALPAASNGLEFVLFHGGIVAEADNWVITTNALAPYKGGILWLDEDAGAADGVDTILPDGTDDIMTIVDPGVGTKVHVICDGTSWFVHAIVSGVTIPTFTTTA